MRLFAFFILLLGLALDTAVAEHEVDHRYNIRGYVLDDRKKAVKNQEVSAYSGGSLLASGKTDSSGYYSLHLHLHNEDRGRKVRLRAGASEAEVRVTFDPDDLSTIRVHEANFVGGRFIEEGLGRFRIPPWVYVVAGFIVIGTMLVMLERRRKAKLKNKQHSAAQKHAPGKARGRKSKSRKH